MPRITEEIPYNGFQAKVARLGLIRLVEEVRKALTSFNLTVEESKNANSAAVVREMVDDAFAAIGGWTKTVSGDVDWTKARAVKDITVRIGVEVQISGRSDMLAVDIIHLRRQIKDGKIDAGIIVVPNETLGEFLTDRTPTIADAKRHIAEADFGDAPIMLVAFEHDAPGEALPKRVTNRGIRKPLRLY